MHWQLNLHHFRPIVLETNLTWDRAPFEKLNYLVVDLELVRRIHVQLARRTVGLTFEEARALNLAIDWFRRLVLFAGGAGRCAMCADIAMGSRRC